MKAILQRVTSAAVSVDGQQVGAIKQGLLILLGVVQGDTTAEMTRLADKIVHLRIFADEAEKMNRSVAEVGGSILLVSQFTLAADCRKGRRPSFVHAANPTEGESLYLAMARYFADQGIPCHTGTFGAKMLVELINDGPVTIILDTENI